MAVERNNVLGGEYMIQDRDHMSEIPQVSETARDAARQAEQSESGARQQGSTEKSAKRPESDSQRQVH